MKATFPTDGIALDRSADQPLPRQLYHALRTLIERGILTRGSVLPSSRSLAVDLRVGRNTIISAYDQLALEGYITIKPGVPPVVIDLQIERDAGGISGSKPVGNLSRLGEVMLSQPFHHGEPGQLTFHPGMPDPENFPFLTWSKMLAGRAKHARRDLFGTYHVCGHPELREMIRRYLAASRGVNCNADQIVVTNGAQSAFDLLARLLLDPGDRVWMEEPGYYGAASAFVSAGARLCPFRVDENGWQPDPAPAQTPRVIFVTPSCHHPFGLTMPLDQRLRLLRMAESWNSWVIEDDYDSEYRFQGQPIPALQGISDSHRVVYVGTFAKILFPAMRLGFMVMPEALAERTASALSVSGQFAPLLTQAALADFMEKGHLVRHLRRMRRLYAARRACFIENCEKLLGDWLEVPHTDSGIQLVCPLRTGLNDVAVAQQARKSGINLSPLSMQYRHEPQRHGLVMGFAAVDEKATLQGMIRLQKILSAMG